MTPDPSLPTGRSRVSPVRRYADAPAAIEWLTHAFGFERQASHPGPDGTIVHAELRFFGSVLGLSSASLATAGNPWSTTREGVYVSVADVDAHHARAVAAGAEIASPLQDLDYGSRDYSARDVGGHLWGFGTYDMGAPSGEPMLFVGLHYDDGPRALAWLVRAFGFTPELQVPGPNGVIAHAELRCGDDVVMMGSAPRAEGHWCDARQAVYGWVADPDAHCARAQRGGATIVAAPADTDYGARAYYARDGEGFLWGFGTYRPTPASAALASAGDGQAPSGRPREQA